jgi:hypothetical protein
MTCSAFSNHSFLENGSGGCSPQWCQSSQRIFDAASDCLMPVSVSSTAGIEGRHPLHVGQPVGRPPAQRPADERS